MIKLGRSQKAVYEWLGRQETAKTAAEVGLALYDKVSCCADGKGHYPDKHYPDQVKIEWARKIMRQLRKNGAVDTDGVRDNANCYRRIG